MAIEVITLRLFVAAILGGVVGIERENQKRAAGLRTHILVSLGSALVMVTSEYMFKLYGGDPGRLGAQVISGIGFLGAGTIIKQGGSVRGLTTAASLWVVACIGLAAGIGFYTAAIITAAIVFLTLALLRKFENVLVRKSKSPSEIIIRIDNKPGKLGEVASYIGKSGVNISNVDIEADDEDKLIVNFTLNLPKGLKKEDVLFKLKALPDVKVIE